MKLDELKKSWGQFNEKLNGQKLVEERQIEEMLSKKRMSNYNKLLRYEQISLVALFLFFLFILSVYQAYSLFWIYLGVAFLVPVLVAFAISLYCYYKLKQAGCMEYDLEHQIYYMLQYKSSLYRGYVAVYLSLIPGIVLFIIYANVIWASIIIGFVLLGVILDIFIFKCVYKKVEKLVTVSKELKELKKVLHGH